MRDYIIAELLKAKKEEEVVKKLEELLAFPSRYPQVLLWYFQKIMKNDALPQSDQEGKKDRGSGSFRRLLQSPDSDQR